MSQSTSTNHSCIGRLSMVKKNGEISDKAAVNILTKPERARLVVGTQPNTCNLTLKNAEGVHPVHAEIFMHSNGREVWVRRNSKDCAVSVNGIPVNETKLNNGDKILFGASTGGKLFFWRYNQEYFKNINKPTLLKLKKKGEAEASVKQEKPTASTNQSMTSCETSKRQPKEDMKRPRDNEEEREETPSQQAKRIRLTQPATSSPMLSPPLFTQKPQGTQEPAREDTDDEDEEDIATQIPLESPSKMQNVITQTSRPFTQQSSQQHVSSQSSLTPFSFHSQPQAPSAINVASQFTMTQAQEQEQEQEGEDEHDMEHEEEENPTNNRSSPVIDSSDIPTLSDDEEEEEDSIEEQIRDLYKPTGDDSTTDLLEDLQSKWIKENVLLRTYNKRLKSKFIDMKDRRQQSYERITQEWIEKVKFMQEDHQRELDRLKKEKHDIQQVYEDTVQMLKLTNIERDRWHGEAAHFRAENESLRQTSVEYKEQIDEYQVEVACLQVEAADAEKKRKLLEQENSVLKQSSAGKQHEQLRNMFFELKRDYERLVSELSAQENQTKNVISNVINKLSMDKVKQITQSMSAKMNQVAQDIQRSVAARSAASSSRATFSPPPAAPTLPRPVPKKFTAPPAPHIPLEAVALNNSQEIPRQRNVRWAAPPSSSIPLAQEEISSLDLLDDIASGSQLAVTSTQTRIQNSKGWIKPRS